MVQDYCLEAEGTDWMTFRSPKRPEHTSPKHTYLADAPANVWSCPKTQASFSHLSPSFLPGESEEISRWSHSLLSGSRAPCHSGTCVLSHLSIPGAASGASGTGGSHVAIPARAWSLAVWRGTGQSAGEQACQSGSSVSLEQFKLLFLHLTALCQP